MELHKMIYKLRNASKMSQEEFATLFNVSRQSVQKWESGTTFPEISKIVEISNHFGISLDSLILDRSSRDVEELAYDKVMTPEYSSMHNWEFYAGRLDVEYMQSIDEGLDIEEYKDVFEAVLRLPVSETKKKMGDALFEAVLAAKRKEGYKYIEPSDLEGIRDLCKEYPLTGKVDKKNLEKQIHGAWMGRVCGCMLGKTLEGVKLHELVPFLKGSDNYPMHRYVYRSDVTEEVAQKYTYPLASKKFADEINGMPEDDDTNYVVLAQVLIDKYGKDFTPWDVSQVWISSQGKNSYCTAERVAYINFMNGYKPPQSAMYQNPYREWIGAQIRGDYFGYINPGNPKLAAEMAWRDASISHVKNGIYGEMFVSAMLAAAAVTNDMEEIILAGLGQIPHTSRLYEDIMSILEDYKAGVSQKEAFDKIHSKYNDRLSHWWCHTISNADIVVASLLYGEGDYAKSICMAVEAAFDTDCNGATVGSVIGMAYGIDSIPEYWQKPINDTLETTIFGVGTVKISDRVKKTMEHIDLK